MNKDPKVFLLHILESIEMIEKYIQGKTKKDFLDSELLQDAFIRRLEIIGEAVRYIPDDVRLKYPQIPWQKVSDMRNKLIHKYFIIDMELVWEVVKKELPKLKTQLKDALEKMV
ncbi:DUF86 domain-containing protein [Patescibacteria group bacterium]|nr:DUF86 domain-containing protein [Patescibacteria group bacterium]